MSSTVFTIETAEGLELELPAVFEVCPRCEGAGSHVNPNVDGNGLTAEDFEQDPDFHEAYMDGAYDVQCVRCGGKRVVPVIDLPRLSPAQRAAWQAHEKAEAEYQRDYDSEAWLRRAEAGE